MVLEVRIDEIVPGPFGVTVQEDGRTRLTIGWGLARARLSSS